MHNLKIKFKNNEDIFQLNPQDATPLLKFQEFEQLDFIKHGFTTRLGGVSDGDCFSLNLGYERGDRKENVRENFNRVADMLNISPESMIAGKQTHTTNVLEVGESLSGNGVVLDNQLRDIDGLITNVQGLCLVTFYADCVPLYFIDPVHKAIGLSHSGWRGTVQKIGKDTIRRMSETYGSKPEDMLVGIGPSICQDCYEVSEDVIDEFRQAFDSIYWEKLFYQKENGKYQLNLWKANEIILLEEGIQKEHLSITNICTCCNSEIMFSHRASHGKRGNLGAFLAIKGEENYV